MSFHQFQSERKNNVHRQRQQSLIFRIRYGLMGTNGRVCLSTNSTAVEWAGEIRSAHDSSSFNCCWLCRVSNLKQYNRRSLLHHHCTGGSITRPTRPFRVGILHFWCDNKLNSHLRSVGCLGRRDLCKTMKIHRMACETESSSFINRQYTGNTNREEGSDEVDRGCLGMGPAQTI